LRITFLGTAAAIPTKERSLPAIHVGHSKTSILLDCGEGTQGQMVKAGIAVVKLDAIFISHLHGDHYYGLPGLIDTLCLQQREEKLVVYGPQGIQKMAEQMLPLGKDKLTFDLQIKEIGNESLFKIKKLNVRTCHSNHVEASIAIRLETDRKYGKFNSKLADELGIGLGPERQKLIEGKEIIHNGKTITPEMLVGPKTDGKSVVYTGDTGPSEEIVELAKDADVLIHESTFLDPKKAEEGGHSTPLDAANTARKANCKQLILFHISHRHKPEEVLEIAQKEFPNVSVAEDFMRIEI